MTRILRKYEKDYLSLSLKSQELSEVLATKLKQAIHEVFENED